MRITWRGASSLGNQDIEAAIRSDIDAALQAIRTRGDQFVVNDTVWYWQNPAGKVMPTVANSAKFITSNFQDHLQRQRGWQAEKALSGQAVDAYKEYHGVFDVFSLEPARLLDLLKAYEIHHGRSSGPVATSIYMQHCQNAAPSLSEDLLPFGEFFQAHAKQMGLRIAIEFETGNIASSFRAGNKLDYLFRAGLIDLGVFVTSNDKPNCAARIWPVSNRNGSFQELDRRGFATGLALPLWQIGFAPDAFDQAAPYLADDGTLYQMQPAGQARNIQGVTYEVWRDARGQERLRPTTRLR